MLLSKKLNPHAPEVNHLRRHVGTATTILPPRTLGSLLQTAGASPVTPCRTWSAGERRWV